MFFFFFFFSSRRRHTRWNCDWSSDVCSSDLEREHQDCVKYLLKVGANPTLADINGVRPVDLAMNSKERHMIDLRSEEHTSELQSQFHLVCRLLLEKKKTPRIITRRRWRRIIS